MVKKITLGIFDDHPITGQGIADLLKSDPNITVSFITFSKEELIDRLKEHVPNVLIMDILAPDVRGLELFESIIKAHRQMKIMAYSSLSSAILVENLLSLGVKAFLNKRQKPEDIFIALNEVLNNNIYVPDDFTSLVKKVRDMSGSVLSARESEILNLIADEYTSIEIAEKLNLSVNTIESHRKNIFHKLDVKNVAGMIMEAARLGYLS